MPQIVKVGKVPHKVYRMRCTRCGTEALFESHEVKHWSDQREGASGSNVTCPVCGAWRSCASSGWEES